MILFGQLLDTINDNEKVIIRSANEHAVALTEEIGVEVLKRIITKEGRQCVVRDLYSDISERNKNDTVTIIYVTTNGYFFTYE